MKNGPITKEYLRELFAYMDSASPPKTYPNGEQVTPVVLVRSGDNCYALPADPNSPIAQIAAADKDYAKTAGLDHHGE